MKILSNGLTLKAVLTTPVADPWPLVVLCHGFLSHKDGSKYRQLAKFLSEAGVGSIRFDFRGCGKSEGLLRESTVSGRWRDLQKVMDKADSLGGFDGRLGLLGSSLGGYLALLEASRNSKVRCVVAWSTPSHLDELAERLLKAAPVDMSKAFYEDLHRVELLSRLEKVQRVLILHGKQDQQVPAEHASRLFGAVQEPKDLHILKDGDHRFSQKEARQKAIRLSLHWFERFL